MEDAVLECEAARKVWSEFWEARKNDPTSYFSTWLSGEKTPIKQRTFEKNAYQKDVSEAYAKSKLRYADCVCFDVDSTVIW